MKAIKVEYQVKESYVEQNKGNIKKVMDAMKSQNINSMVYSSYYLGDGRFMHLNITNTENFGELNELQEFKDFQNALKASEPIEKPKATDLELVGISKNIFN
jgi:hypothetical protein